MARSLAAKGIFTVAVLVCSLTLVGCPSKEVIVMDDHPEFSLDKLWADCVSFFTGESGGLEVGDIIVGSDGGGFLRRLTGVDEDDGKVTVDTEFVSLAEAIEDGILAGDVTFNADDFAKSGAPLAKAGSMTLDLSGIVLFSKDGVSLSISNGSLTVTPTLSLNATFSNFEMTAFKADTRSDMTLDLNLRLQVTGSKTLNWETDIIPPITKPFIFYIGPVPVVGTASLSFPFGITGTINGTAAVESGFDVTTYFELGAELNNGAWTTTSDFGDFDPNPHPIVITFSSGAGLDFYVKVCAGLNLYGCSNLTGYVQPYLATDVQFVPSPFTFVLSAGVNGGIGYELGIFDFKLIDKDWFFPGPQWELYRFTYPYDIPTTFTFTLP